MALRAKAMILAAGGGTRLYPLTFSVAKPMVPVLNRPVMEHIVGLLRRHGVTDLIANLHHHADQISSYFGNGSSLGVRLEYSREEVILGTAGGAKNVASFFAGETFIVIGGDDLADFDLGAMGAFHRARGALATMAVSEVASEQVSQLGIVVTDGDGRIRSFQEKPRPEDALSRLANTGVYMFEAEILNFIPDRKFFDFGKQVFPLLLEKRAPFFAWAASGYWKDIGTPREYLEANMDALEGRAGLEPLGREVSPGIWREAGARTEGAQLDPPAALGADCRLEQGSRVRRCVIGAGAKIGEAARLDRCVVWPGVEVSEVRARDAIITPDCIVWA